MAVLANKIAPEWLWANHRATSKFQFLNPPKKTFYFEDFEPDCWLESNHWIVYQNFWSKRSNYTLLILYLSARFLCLGDGFGRVSSRILSVHFCIFVWVKVHIDVIQHSPWNSTLRLEIACVRDFYVLRSHMDSTRFEPFILTLNFRNHGYSTSKSWLVESHG